MADQLKAVLVTGATGGIGCATVARLDQLGWRVFAGVRSTGAADRLARAGQRVGPVILDITDGTSVSAAREQVARQIGSEGLQGVVNLAGISVDGPVELLPLDALRRQFEVNVIGQVAVTQAFLPLLRTGQGRIVNVGGAAGRLTLPMYGALSASKAALDSLTDALRMELKHQGVNVVYIEPGAVNTDFFDKSTAAARQLGCAGDNEIERLYSKAIDASINAMRDAAAIPVAQVVDAITRALTVRRPAARYIVGSQAKAVFRILRHLPTGARDRVIGGSVGVTKASFDGPPQIEPSTAR
jgi:NAD(P)-dependent dehydrogenase (short-subunit alcohol dehydrogenase family)